ncbi:MAG: tetratricopeptide repeat protein [Opitutaceae bacterium]
MKVSSKILSTVSYILLLTACDSKEIIDKAPIKVTPISVESSSDNPEAMYQMGRYYQGQKRYDLAIDAYRKALDVSSNFVEALNGLGVIYSKQRKYDEAIEAFQSAIRLNPKAAHILNNLGYVYFLQGRYSESLLTLEQSVAIDPLNKHALINIGTVYAKTGHITDAEKAFSRAVDVPSQVVNADSVISNPSVDSLSSSSKTPIYLGEVHQTEEQSLSLPKSILVIRSASGSMQSIYKAREGRDHVTLLQVSPYVYEIHLKLSQPKTLEKKVVGEVKKSLGIEVSNGNGVTGMARKVSELLKNQGYDPSRLTNQKPYNITNTQIQYRKGYEVEAEHLQAVFSQTSALIKRNDMRSDINLRILLGKDIALKRTLTLLN